MSTFEVHFVALSECLVSSGNRLELGEVKASGIHYNHAGTGKTFIGDDSPIDLSPHTLVVVPANCPFRIEVAADRGTTPPLKSVDGRLQTIMNGTVRNFATGDGEPEIILICGYFHASYGPSNDLFGTLSPPIVEQFDVSDQLDHKLKSALPELIAQEVGTGAMTAALLKQVIVALLRQSISSMNLWVERFSMFSDRQIARAFSDMAAHLGAPHTTHGLAQSPCLRRSMFMARFIDLIGRSPMIILRDLRMRRAAQQLKANKSIDQVAHNVDYASQSSFVRGFRKAYGSDPSDYRAKAPADRQNAVLLNE
ncbi:MAG: AraC family transcriptional regulator [Methylocella sp.]